MAGDNQQPPLARPNRRGSWARALERVKDAMKRRSSSSRSLQTIPQAQVDRPSQEPAIDTPLPSSSTAQIPRVSEEPARSESVPIAPAETPVREALVAAENDVEVDEDPKDDQDVDELPTFSTRTTITDERARDLFAKYNMKYDPRGKRPQQEPPNKIRRVEKPVRLRVHWTCHECRSQFGMEKVCMNCGHRRCRECVRHPPKRRSPVFGINQPQAEEEQEQTQALPVQPVQPAQPFVDEEETTGDADLQSYRDEPSAPPLSAEEDASPKGTPRTLAPAATGGEPSTSRPLEIDDDAGADYENLRSTQLMVYTRPRAAIHTVIGPTAKSIRRTCHECNTPMLPSSRHNCPNCGHKKCDLCSPVSNTEPQPGPSTQEPEEEVPMVRAVKRVYRKPRQRVRYRCENCNTHFVESDRCVECGHERCQTCHREPPKRHHRAHDAEILAAVANRLAAYGGGLGQPPGIAASG